MPNQPESKAPFVLELYDKFKENFAAGKMSPTPYDPPQDFKDRTAQVIKDYQLANTTRNKPYREFNDMSLTQRIALDQASFNQFVEAASTDPADAWRSRAFRPIVRNKIITIAAHITASIIYPNMYAQDKNDEEDKDAAMVMKDLMEWAAEQANYDKTFVASVINALVDPACFIYTEYTERFRKIKQMVDIEEIENSVDPVKKDWKEVTVKDELFSGFQDHVIPCDELWIANIYEPDIQKQPYVIWRRVIDYETVRAKYGGNPIFDQHVRPGVQWLYSDEQNLFYFQYDQNLVGNLCEEVIYWNRAGDLQLVFINGILITDPDMPNSRMDKKYPITKGGYEMIHSRFFYYKSLAYKLSNDEEVINTAYRMLADGTYLKTFPPAVVFGNEEIDSAVIAPGMVTTISNHDNPGAAFQVIETKNDLSATYQLLEKFESSVTESSSDILQTGVTASQGGDMTAFEVSRIEQNARVMLGLFGKMLGFMVKDFGELRKSDILQFLTVGEAMEIEDKNGRLKFKTFVLPDKTVDGKTKTKKISFDMELPDEGNDKSFMKISRGIQQDEEKHGDTVQIARVNPGLFRKLKFLCVVVPEALLPKSEALEKALLLEQYGYAIANQYTDKEAVTRDLLLGAYAKTKDDPDKYLMKQQPQQPGQQPGGMMQGPQPGQPMASPAILKAAGGSVTPLARSL